MFATRNNNENAIYDQQTAAAAKPLNQGVKGLAAKTPTNKAVHKVSLNDENAAFKAKGKDGGLFGGGSKADRADKITLMTPAGPGTRAPLGNKTTNAKATAFKTPGVHNQEKGSVRATSPRLRRAKVKVQVDPLSAVDDEEEREIEYMAPREVPLPDHPDDWPADRSYPQFEGKNFTRGWWSISQPLKDENADDLSDLEEKLKKFEERERKKKAQALKTPVLGSVTKKLATRLPSSEVKISGLTSQGAAVALSSTSIVPSYATPTVSTKSRRPSSLVAKKPTGNASRLGHAQHTAAKVASNTTLGYSKGRTVSANARTPMSRIYQPPTINDGTSKGSPMKMPFGAGTSLDALLGLTNLHDDDDDTDTLVGNTSALDALDDDLDDFQLPSV